jgi:predicted nucleic acid-binding protein
MILLDTDVISEALKTSGNENVLAWMDAQIVETLYLSTISLAELRFGIAALPDGKRRETLNTILEKKVLPVFAGRILSFDDPASQSYATIRSKARAVGLAIAPADGFIAAIAADRGFAVATRDASPFDAAGIRVINPWNRQAH